MKKLIDGLVQKLFEAEQRRLDAGINELNALNKQVRNSKVDGFIYGGVFYRPTSGALTLASPGQAKPTLHYSLCPQMDAWIADWQTIRDDKALISQMFFRLLKPCKDLRDIRNALPECIVGLVQELKQHPRADEEGWTLRGDERAMRQFHKLLPKIEAYSATRLLY